MRLFEMFEEKIDEVNMSPGALADFAKSEFAQSMTAGFETEIIVPNIINKEDLEKLSKYPNDIRTKSYEQVYDFFIQANNTETKVNAVIKALVKEQKSGKDSEYRLRRITSGNDESFLNSFYHMMSDIKAKFRSLNWPYEPSNAVTSKNITSEQLSQVIAKAIGMPVKYASGYHDVKRGTGYFILEPDSSIGQDEDHDNTLDENEAGLELVSPPMPLAQTFEYLDKVFSWAKKYKCRTDSSTGFHMGISIPNQNKANVDYLKFILFLGDEYVLSQFGREDNTYAQNMSTIISGNIPSDIQLEKMFKSMRNGMNSRAAKLLSNKLIDNNDKYVSVNIKDNYIEVRSAGGEDYIKNVDKIKLTLMRYVRAMGIAADPEAEKNEYAKKVYKLLSKNFSKNYGNNNMMTLFARYSSKQITSNDLMTAIHKIRQEKAANQYWKKPNAKIPEPKAGQGTEYFIISNGKILHKVVAKTRRDAEVMAEKWVAENPDPIYDYSVVLSNSKMAQQATAATGAAPTTGNKETRIPKKYRVHFSLNGESFSKNINTQSEDEAYDWMAVNLPMAKIEAVTPIY
jgi:hypothetical protein